MNDFATVDDIIALWRPLTPEEIERAKKLLPIISDVLRQEAMNVGKDLDQMLSDGEVLPGVVKSVTVDVAARTLNTPSDGAPMTQMLPPIWGSCFASAAAAPTAQAPMILWPQP